METGVRWALAPGWCWPHLRTDPEPPEGTETGRAERCDRPQGRCRGGGHQSQESNGLGLCPEGEVDPLKGFKPKLRISFGFCVKHFNVKDRCSRSYFLELKFSKISFLRPNK